MSKVVIGLMDRLNVSKALNLKQSSGLVNRDEDKQENYLMRIGPDCQPIDCVLTYTITFYIHYCGPNE